MADGRDLYTGMSLHIGLNHVAADAYGGWNGQLWGCENDAWAMFRIAQAEGYASTILLNEQATIERVKSEIRWAADGQYPADSFLLTYSGHGGQLPDTTGDEDDYLDETWCLYDGEMLDDELFILLKFFPERTRIVVVSDSCHSGTMIREPAYQVRGMPQAAIQPAYEARKDYYDGLRRLGREKYDLPASVCLLSGCQDNQYSWDGTDHGLFTGKLLEVWQDGGFNGDYWQFNREILRRMPADQSPGLMFMGQRNLHFEWSRPFVIREL